MNNIFERLIEDDIKFYSDNLIYWLVTINCVRKPVDVCNLLYKGLQYSPVGSLYIDSNLNKKDIIEIQTEIWSTSESEDFLNTSLDMIKKNIELSLPKNFEYEIKINKSDIDKEYVDIDDVSDNEYDNLYRCLKHETDYFNKKDNKNET